ncbi:MAG: hypothetical protein WAX18_06665, partial [Lactococcus raffinolactis]
AQVQATEQAQATYTAPAQQTPATPSYTAPAQSAPSQPSYQVDWSQAGRDRDEYNASQGNYDKSLMAGAYD